MVNHCLLMLLTGRMFEIGPFPYIFPTKIFLSLFRYMYSQAYSQSWGTTQQYTERCSSSSSTLLFSFYTYSCRTFLPWAFISFTKSRVDLLSHTLPLRSFIARIYFITSFPFFANAPLISDAQLGSTLSLGAARGSQVTPGCLWTCAEPSSPHVNFVLINQCCWVLTSYALGCLKHRTLFLIFELLRPRWHQQPLPWAASPGTPTHTPSSCGPRSPIQAPAWAFDSSLGCVVAGPASGSVAEWFAFPGLTSEPLLLCLMITGSLMGSAATTTLRCLPGSDAVGPRHRGELAALPPDCKGWEEASEICT